MILLECNDPVLLPFLKVIKDIFTMIQILGPIICIIILMVLFTKLMINPDDPQNKLKNSIKNSIISLVILFLLPTLVNLVMYVLGDTFTVTACWNKANNYKITSSEYKKTEKDKTKIIKQPTITSTTTTGEYSDVNGKNMADVFVNLAVAQKKDSSAHGGKKYWSYMGYKSHIQWCACFVGWVIGHTEYNGEKMTDKYIDKGYGSCKSILNACKKSEKCKYYDQGTYTPKRGDIIFYTWDHRKSVGHVGIVQYVKNGRVKTIEGNCGDKICEQNMKTTDKRIYGYAVWS